MGEENVCYCGAYGGGKHTMSSLCVPELRLHSISRCIDDERGVRVLFNHKPSDYEFHLFTQAIIDWQNAEHERRERMADRWS